MLTLAVEMEASRLSNMIYLEIWRHVARDLRYPLPLQVVGG